MLPYAFFKIVVVCFTSVCRRAARCEIAGESVIKKKKVAVELGRPTAKNRKNNQSDRAASMRLLLLVSFFTAYDFRATCADLVVHDIHSSSV